MDRKKLMEKSLDYRWLEKQRNINMSAVIVALIVVFLGYVIESNELMMTFILLALIMFVYLIICHIKAIYLIKNCERYEIQDAVLDDAHISIWFRTMYYKVNVRISDTETKKIKTKPMWYSSSIGGFGYFRSQAYSGKAVKIAYDKLKDRVYVLGLKKELEKEENTL